MAINLVGGSTTGLGFGLSSAHLDSSSTTSSCSSSTPSSPALLLTSHLAPATQTPPSASQHIQFRFPGQQNTIFKKYAHNLDIFVVVVNIIIGIVDVARSDRAQSVEVLSPMSHAPSLPVMQSAKSSVLNLTASMGSTLNNQIVEETTTSQNSHDSDKTVSVSAMSATSCSNSASTDSERTYRVDSQDSQVSDTETTGDRQWPRQNSVSL